MKTILNLISRWTTCSTNSTRQTQTWTSSPKTGITAVVINAAAKGFLNTTMPWTLPSFRCSSASSPCKTRRLNRYFSITPWTTCRWLKESKTLWATSFAIKYPARALFLTKASSLETTSLISLIRGRKSQRAEASQFSSHASLIWHAPQSNCLVSLWRTTLRKSLWIQSKLATLALRKYAEINLIFLVSSRKIWTFCHRGTYYQNFIITQRSRIFFLSSNKTQKGTRIFR